MLKGCIDPEPDSNQLFEVKLKMAEYNTQFHFTHWLWEHVHVWLFKEEGTPR